jgi:hypothetical protein
MNYELLSLALLYISIVMLTLSVFLMFLFIDSRTNELRDRVIHILISASFFGILISFNIMFTLDFIERLP